MEQGRLKIVALGIKKNTEFHVSLLFVNTSFTDSVTDMKN